MASACRPDLASGPGGETAIHIAATRTPSVGYAADIGLICQTEGMGRFVPPDNVEALLRPRCRSRQKGAWIAAVPGAGVYAVRPS